MIKNIRLVGRQDEMVDIMLPDRKSVSSYKIFVSATMQGAYDFTGLIAVSYTHLTLPTILLV